MTETPKIRSYYQIDNMNPTDELGVHNGDIKTCERALLERMYFCKVDGRFIPPPITTVAGIQNSLKDVTNAFSKLLFKATPVTPEAFLDLYRGPLRTRYENAYIEYKRTGIQRKHAFSNFFVKFEKVKRANAPRGIQPRHAIYNLRLGRFIKPIEHRVYKCLGRLFGDGPTVMKGYNTNEVANIIKGKFNSFARCAAIGLDATKFDAHCEIPILKFEHQFYHKIFSNNVELRMLLSWQLNNVGMAYAEDGFLKYKVNGKRFSGDMNTALGNCIIMCCLVWQYAHDRNIPVKLVNNGDDCVVFMEAAHEPLFRRGMSEWFINVGFRMVAEPTAYKLEHIEFCQMNPVEVPGGYNMCRNPHAVFSKDTMCLKAKNDTEIKAWMGAVGTGGLMLYGNMPVISSYYNLLYSNGLTNGKCYTSYINSRDGWFNNWRGNLSIPGKFNIEISDSSRISFWEAFKITPDEQVKMEQEIGKTILCGKASTDILTTYRILLNRNEYETIKS